MAGSLRATLSRGSLRARPGARYEIFYRLLLQDTVNSMELTGFAGLQAAFGGTTVLWKARVKAGLPILSEPGLRSGKARLFDSVAVFAWLQEHEPARPCGNLDRNQEQAALFAVQRELKALELAQRKTELIPADVVQRVWSGFTGAARAPAGVA